MSSSIHLQDPLCVATFSPRKGLTVRAVSEEQVANISSDGGDGNCRIGKGKGISCKEGRNVVLSGRSSCKLVDSYLCVIIFGIA